MDRRTEQFPRKAVKRKRKEREFNIYRGGMMDFINWFQRERERGGDGIIADKLARWNCFHENQLFMDSR